MFGIPTFQEYIDLALNAPRVVGMYGPPISTFMCPAAYNTWTFGRNWLQLLLPTADA
jgi:hypothetical protein